LEKTLLQSFKDPAVLEVINKYNMAYDPMDAKAVSNVIAKDFKVFGELFSRLGVGIYKK
jgi:hypothetical protein